MGEISRRRRICHDVMCEEVNTRHGVLFKGERRSKSMKNLLKYLRDYKKETILAPTFKLLEAFFELLVPLVLASIIDYGIGDKTGVVDEAHIWKMGLCLVGLAVVGLVSSITAQFFAARAATGFATKLRSALFKHLQSLNFTNIDQIGTSTMISRMTSDINQVQNGVNMVLRLFLRSPIIVFGAMIGAFIVDVECALVFAVAIPVLAVIVFGIMIWTRPYYKKVQSYLDRVLGITRENLTGVRVIRAFHREEEEKKLFNESNNMLAGMQMYVARISVLMNPVTFLVVNAATMLLIYKGGVKVNIGELSSGQVMAILNYMGQILVELVKLANLIVTITKALACADRVEAAFKITNKESEKQTTQDASGAYIHFDHVGITYEGAGEETLKDIDFTVQKGETVGIIGGTGSGKTSLVNLLAGYYPATQGCIYLNGKALSAYEEDELKEQIGMVPQKAVLFKGTIKSNLLWGKPDATTEEMWDALTIAQAKEIVEGKDGQLDAEVAQNGKNFSGGQKQRLTIARALIRKPEILILDDSASALDYATDARLREALKGIEKETTTFIVSQRASSIRHADKIIVLDDGEVAGIGTHDQLLAECSVYQEIYYSQYERA